MSNRPGIRCCNMLLIFKAIHGESCSRDEFALYEEADVYVYF